MTIKGTKAEIEMIIRKLFDIRLPIDYYETVSKEKGITGKYVGIPINIEITEKDDK